MTMPRDDTNDKEILADARLLYSSCVDEIAGFKQQQWSTTNYAMLLYAATVSLPKLLSEPLSQVSFAALLLAALAVLVAAWILVGQLSEAIRVRRERLTHLRKYRLSEEFRNSWRAGKTPEDCPDHPAEKTDLVWFFRAAQSAGFAATLWLLVRALCAA